MADGQALHLSMEEARGLMLAAQGLLDPPAAVAPTQAEVAGLIDRLGVVQIDTISVVERTQYLVLWSRLGPYDATHLDAQLYPGRQVFEYWSHAASIVPMADYPYYRPKMLRYHEWIWRGDHEWMRENPQVVRDTLERVRERGPLASADFERSPDARRVDPWTWYGGKESRRALEVLWTTGDLMVHSRRGGQKVYDLRERVLAEAFNGATPPDDALPHDVERQRYFMRRTVRALGVSTASWLWDYFRLAPLEGQARSKRAAAQNILDALQAEGEVVPATIEGLAEPVAVSTARLPDLERLRAGYRPTRTTLLSPFDSLIWDRARARALFGYEVCFEAYVPPPKRRYGYYCLAILHRGRLVGRVDPKMERVARRLTARSIHLEPGVEATDDLLDGLAAALRELARFLGADTVAVERSDPAALAPALAERMT